MELSVKVAVRICPPFLNSKPLKQHPIQDEQHFGISLMKSTSEKCKTPSYGVNKSQSLPDINVSEQEKTSCQQQEKDPAPDPHYANMESNPDSRGAKPKMRKLDNEPSPPPLKCCVQTLKSPITPPPGVPSGLVQVGPHTFPVTHALPINCSQQHVYTDAVLPMMTLFMEGFDASVVTYGQRSCGKTYSLYGKGFGEGVVESDHGIVAYCVREIFTHIGHHPERTYTVNITWVEVCRDIIKDLFGVGSVQCMSMSDVFHWLQVGYNLLYNSNLRMGHSLFSLTLEQRWISREGLIQHRLSTASFTDLGPTERLQDQPRGMPKDLGLQALEHVVNVLADPNLLAKVNGNVPYNHTALSAMLKDSFGGRAQSLVLVCVSPFERDAEETLWNMQFAFKAQLVRNIVVINSYSDDNTPVPLDAIMPEAKEAEHQEEENDHFMLQFAAKQWSNLVSSAEELLTKLLSCNALPEQEKLQVNNWLLKKQEYEECLKSSESSKYKKNLSIIREDDEFEGAAGGEGGEEENDHAEDSLSSEVDTALRVNSGQETDNESEKSDIDEHLEYLMDNLTTKTDDMILKKYQAFMDSHPKGIMESLEEKPSSKKKPIMDFENEEERRLSSASLRRADGRRRSVIPGTALSSADLDKLNRLALRGNIEHEKPTKALMQSDEDILNVSLDVRKIQKTKNNRLEVISKKLRKLDTDIEARLKQIKEIEETMNLQQNIIAELMRNNECSATAKQKFHKKRGKLEAEYEKNKKSFQKALTQGRRDKNELERLKGNIIRLEQRLNDVTSLKDIAGESSHKVKKLQRSLNESKKLIEGLQKKVKREKKLKESLKNELLDLSAKENSKALVKHRNGAMLREEKKRNLREVQSRIDHLDHVLKEKSDNLQQFEDHKQREVLRFEIRNLRKTRDLLLDQRCSLDSKMRRDKTLSLKEERKLLECEEAIEAIDAAIEFKNELICGHRSIDTRERLQREKGEQMLMERLNNLSSEEMRTLLYKYFIKVIDLRDSSYNLEKQLSELEKERDAWEWKERVLSNAIRQVRLEGERNAVRLQKQHEMKLTLMLRHMAEDSCNSSGGSFTERSIALTHYYRDGPYATGPMHLANADTSYSSYNSMEYDWPHYEMNKAAAVSSASETMPDDPTKMQMTKFKHYEKPKEKDKESKNKLFAKFHMLTRYTSSGSSSPSEDIAAGVPVINKGKRKSKELLRSKENDENQGQKIIVTVPLTERNLKNLSEDKKKSNVTRQRNKLVIQNKSKRQDT